MHNAWLCYCKLVLAVKQVCGSIGIACLPP
ncbi:DUF3265 domain-containing protein [Vibrio owensii]|nr:MULTISPECIES: DUF3265 domain-containing protein [Vibrio]NOI71473.1 DUF3265 domain-containing protein [Vibrio owensii]QLK47288.1 DUF3265 domain-containing protein [Vibrio owensii]